ncbi:MAG: hypothetical protein D6712_08045 [Chloroflexi bacterium]|nr:MAG: hypothetical protein D6712_08045 [Chloroflexota bacterium]
MPEYIKIQINGMTCKHCEETAQNLLEAIDGVESATIDNWESGITHLEASKNIPLEAIEDALSKGGYRLANTSKRAGNPLIAVLLLSLMVGGLALIIIVFSSRFAARPTSLAEIPSNNNQNLTSTTVESETASTNEIADIETNNTASFTLPIIALDNPPEQPPALNFSVTPDVEIAGEIRIPDNERPITVLLFGTAGCSTCGIEAQSLARIVEEHDTEHLRVVFVDIYNVGGSQQLAWFANVLQATNLTWAVDTEGVLRELLGVDIDATLILDRQGNILYRDDFLTPDAVLREQIERALEAAL